MRFFSVICIELFSSNSEHRNKAKNYRLLLYKDIVLGVANEEPVAINNDGGTPKSSSVSSVNTLYYLQTVCSNCACGFQTAKQGKRETTPISSLLSNANQVYLRRYQGISRLLGLSNQEYESFQFEHYKRNPSLLRVLLSKYMTMSHSS
jgi:hypothetical protein